MSTSGAQATEAIPSFAPFGPGEKAAAVVGALIVLSPFLGSNVSYVLRQGIVPCFASFHSRTFLRAPLRRLGGILRHLQTNIVPESFARGILLPFPTRAVCDLFAV